MANKLWALAGVAAMAMVPAMVGCAAETAAPENLPRGESVAEGLTVLPTTDDTHLNIAFRKENITIFLQANRGHLAPAPYQPKEGAPVYEIDARFVADNGRTFYLRRGGDEYVDPTWGEDFVRDQTTPMPSISNENLFAMAQEASELLDTKAAEQLGTKFSLHAQELAAIRTFGKEAVAQFRVNKEMLVAHRAKVGEDVKEIPYGSGGGDVGNVYLGQNYYYIAVHRKSIYLFGEHSATQTNAWSGSAWFVQVDMCNHGECAGGMGRKCLLQYYERTNGGYGGFELQTCKTGYDAFSGGGGHNCHDDSRLQLSNFHHGNWNGGYSQWCNGGGGGISAPGCYDYNY